MRPPAVTGSASAGTPALAGPAVPAPATVRSLWRVVWSKMIVTVHVVLAQNVSCAAALANPPALSVLMLVVALSDARRTGYSGPLYALNSARVVLCAATHGVPPEA